jgi:hypothetical protein
MANPDAAAEVSHDLEAFFPITITVKAISP